MKWIVAALASLALCRGSEGAGVPPRYRPADAVRVAAAFARLKGKDAYRYRYVSMHATTVGDRELYFRGLGKVTNSLNSKTTDIVLPVPLGDDGLVAAVDIYALGIDPCAWDDLGLKGSGAAPFPDPFFHLIVVADVPDTEDEYIDVGYWQDGFGRQHAGSAYSLAEGRAQGLTFVKTGQQLRAKGKKGGGRRVEKVAQGNWLPKEDLADLLLSIKHDGRQFQVPILEFRWFVGNALIEPRYHELAGLPDSEEALKKLFDVDEKVTDRLGAQTRGAVVHSEVATRNRALERYPTRLRFGKGSFHESIDFKTSVRAQDVLADLLVDDGDADELIFTLPNGLLGYYIAVKGKRVDFADPEIAQDGRTSLKDHLVWTARNCMACHEAESGFIHIDDEARVMARGKNQADMLLLVDRYSKKDPARARRIKDRYFTVDFNLLLDEDRKVFEASCWDATKLAQDPNGPGMTGPQVTALIADVTWQYWDQPVNLRRLSRDLGYPDDTVLGVLERSKGIDHTLVGLTIGRTQRRDQTEASFGQLAGLLATLPIPAVPK